VWLREVVSWILTGAGADETYIFRRFSGAILELASYLLDLQSFCRQFDALSP
jgi:hypothetical protein